MSHGPKHRTFAQPSTRGSQPKPNGKRRRAVRMATSIHGVRLLPTQHWRCLDNIMCMKSRFWRPSSHMMTGEAPMAFTTWQETWPNGYKTGSGSTTMPICRLAIHKVRRRGAIKAFVEALGKAGESCSARRREVDQPQINVRQRSDSGAHDHPRPPNPSHPKSRQQEERPAVDGIVKLSRKKMCKELW